MDSVAETRPTLAELLPQAGPMILLTDYDAPDGERSATARVAVTEKSPFYERSLGGVPGCVALEYMAQTMALATGMARRAAGLPPKIGFVLGSRSLRISVPCFAAGSTYTVRVECTYSDESFGSFDCVIRDPSGREAASATVNAFQPEGDVSSKNMEAYR